MSKQEILTHYGRKLSKMLSMKNTVGKTTKIGQRNRSSALRESTELVSEQLSMKLNYTQKNEIDKIMFRLEDLM